MNYGRIMQYARKKCGMTQAEAAQKLNISVNSLSNYETNKRNITLDLYVQMSQLYNFDMFGPFYKKNAVNITMSYFHKKRDVYKNCLHRAFLFLSHIANLTKLRLSVIMK